MIKRIWSVALLSLCACGDVNFRFAAEYEPTYEIANGAESRLKIGGRHYILSHLEAIFGPLAANQSSLVLNNPGIFGGKEDYYENFSSTFALVESNPLDMSSRQALAIRLCHLIVQDDARVKVGVGNITGTMGVALDAAFTKGPSEVRDIELSYNAFFPGRDLPAEVSTSLEQVAREATALKTSGIEGWRFLLLTLCLDPGWQLL